MANLLDYIAWRGDLKLQQIPQNEVDCLIFSWLSYIAFDGIVSEDFNTTISLRDAATQFLKKKKARSENDRELLKVVSQSARFSKLQLCGYVNHINLAQEKQFAALCIRLEDGTCFISYRGTDNTLVGWKEDFNMSFMSPVPAQQEAVAYLQKAAERLPGALLLGGHSKGGNLAVFAGAFCGPKIQNRIMQVYNNDGPGFLSSVLQREGYQRISPKIKTFIPQTSVIGLLLEHEEPHVVVHSTQVGIMQHDLHSWEVMRNHFIYLETTDKQSKFVDMTLKNWVSQMQPAQRERLVDILFDVLESTKVKTVAELSSKWSQNAKIILKSIQDIENDDKKELLQILGMLFKSIKQAAPVLLLD